MHLSDFYWPSVGIRTVSPTGFVQDQHFIRFSTGHVFIALTEGVVLLIPLGGEDGAKAHHHVKDAEPIADFLFRTFGVEVVVDTGYRIFWKAPKNALSPVVSAESLYKNYLAGALRRGDAEAITAFRRILPELDRSFAVTLLEIVANASKRKLNFFTPVFWEAFKCLCEKIRAIELPLKLSPNWRRRSRFSWSQTAA